MDFSDERSGGGTVKGFVTPAFFLAGWVAAVAVMVSAVGSLRTNIEDVLSAKQGGTVSATSCPHSPRIAQFDS